MGRTSLHRVIVYIKKWHNLTKLDRCGHLWYLYTACRKRKPSGTVFRKRQPNPKFRATAGVARYKSLPEVSPVEMALILQTEPSTGNSESPYEYNIH